ncbi:hypothetical protein [Paracidovorax valerianellae]|uniref:Phage integrase family protein n=1 Tax=Paracidovorax valerianellae TaxID=187868 RepID=A0A1G6YUT6_9BURK|nr:hypothetical protein [Paracidovorax valerianellae]MDA8447338.1 hypothetical protein [Paracidovorax valerianellae]SDD94098.1 hypothetical protein SAMN05192589_110166 [Paracidovorax valerianellae]
MAYITNQSQYRVSVENRDDLTILFPFNKFDAASAYMAELRVQHLTPRAEQLNDRWFVHIRKNGRNRLRISCRTRKEAESYVTGGRDARTAANVVRDTVPLVSIGDVALPVWRHRVDKNPVSAVSAVSRARRSRRISHDEEARLLKSLAELDLRRSVASRLREMTDAEIASQTFTCDDAREKALAEIRARLKPVAVETAEVIPYLQVFYLFQVMTAATRRETLGIAWEDIDFEAQTVHVQQAMTVGRPKLSLRVELIDHLRKLPQNTSHVFDISPGHLMSAWRKAGAMAGVEDLLIQDVRYEALSQIVDSGQFTHDELQAFSGAGTREKFMRHAPLSASWLARKLDECCSSTTEVPMQRS